MPFNLAECNHGSRFDPIAHTIAEMVEFYGKFEFVEGNKHSTGTKSKPTGTADKGAQMAAF